MVLAQQVAGSRLVLSPHEALVAGGPAGEFEERVQPLFRAGHIGLLVTGLQRGLRRDRPDGMTS